MPLIFDPKNGLKLIPLDQVEEMPDSGPSLQIKLDLEDRIKLVLSHQNRALDHFNLLHPNVRTVRDYWCLKNLSPESKERVEFLAGFLESGEYDSSEPFLMFEPHELADADWLNIMAYYYDNPTKGNPFFNADLAFGLYIHAARLGSKAACYNIAQAYKNGHERNIDEDEAAYWFQKAFENGHGCAGTEIFDRNVNDPRYGHPDHQSFTDETNALPETMIKMNSPWGYMWKARLMLGGWTETNSTDWAIETYKGFASLPKGLSCAIPRVNAIWALALRHFLEMDISSERDNDFLEKARTYLADIPADTNSAEMRFGIFWKASLLIKVIDDMMIDNSLASEYQNATLLMRRMKDGLVTSQELKAQVNNGEIDITEPLLSTLWAASQLVENEGWKHDPGYRDVAQYLLKKELGLDDDTLFKSRLLMGPLYNALNEYGFPAMGCLYNASTSLEQIAADRSQYGAYVPLPGVLALTGLHTTKDGTIEFDCIQSHTQPAMLVQEDFDVCLSLIFGKAAKPIMPSLGLEPLRITPIKDELASGISKKVWDPAWLGHTDFGKTLMIADYYIGTVVWNYAYLSLIQPHDEESSKLHDRGQNLIDGLFSLGGRNGEGQSGRVMLHPAVMKFSVERKKPFVSREIISLKLRKAQMMVDGSYWARHPDGTEDRAVALNDPAFKHGKAAKYITDRYNNVAGLIPTFERARQMMILLHGLDALRKTGWRPAPSYQAQITHKLKAFEALPPLSRQELHCI